MYELHEVQTKNMYFQKNAKSLSSHGVRLIKILILQVFAKIHTFYGLSTLSKDAKILK